MEWDQYSSLRSQ